MNQPSADAENLSDICDFDEDLSAADDNVLDDLLHKQPAFDDEEALLLQGEIEIYLTSVKNHVQQEINSHGMPKCYRECTFWIHPQDAFFALQKESKSANQLNPHPLYR